MATPERDPGHEPADHGTTEHPKGTLAICLLYFALFTAGWFVFYFCIFMPRGPVR